MSKKVICQGSMGIKIIGDIFCPFPDLFHLKRNLKKKFIAELKALTPLSTWKLVIKKRLKKQILLAYITLCF